MSGALGDREYNWKNEVLYLSGVYKKDCKKVEDMFENALLSEVEGTSVQSEYSKIPIYFTTLAMWPTCSSLLCWWCHRKFTGRPWFEPQNLEVINESKGIYNIGVKGNFCGPRCVKAYIDVNNPLHLRGDRTDILKIVYEIFNGKKITNIIPMPMPQVQITYGGNISPNDYGK
jgi:hypothetical protein